MNEVFKRDGWFISYNPDTSQGLGGLIDAMFGFPAGDETAIVVRGRYYILKGDWREELLGLDLGAALAVFAQNPEHHGPTSDELHEKGTA